MFLEVDDNSHITGYYEVGCGGIEYEGEVPEGFVDNPCLYDFADGFIVLNESAKRAFTIEEIRAKREKECFSIINRGEPWYMQLTPAQMEELLAWYQAWLDAPQTGIIPEKPEWII